MPRLQARIERRARIPHIWLMTDERIPTEALLRAAGRLPRGSGIVLRHHATPEAERFALFEQLRNMARRRGLVLILAGPVAQARLWQADGAHGRPRPGERRKARLPGFIRTISAHHHREARAAVQAGADALFISPLFATRSHPGARPLGPARFAVLARQTPIPVLALGGVHPRHVALVRALGAWGYGAIDGLTVRSRSFRT